MERCSPAPDFVFVVSRVSEELERRLLSHDCAWSFRCVVPGFSKVTHPTISLIPTFMQSSTMAYRWATYCLLLTICSFVTVTRAAGLRIKVEERQVQSSAQCNSGYEWAFSGNNDSPCLAAEKVHMVCEGSKTCTDDTHSHYKLLQLTGAHTLEQLLPEHHYNRPSKSTASECSWYVQSPMGLMHSAKSTLTRISLFYLLPQLLGSV